MILNGPRVSIRPVEWEDLPSLCKWWNDPIVMREVRAEKFKPTLEQIQEESWPVWQNPAPDQFHMFIIWLEDRRIGEIGHEFKDPNSRVASADIKIGEPSLWGQGLGAEAMKLMTSYLFNQLHARQITAQVGDWNTRSQRMFEKCGFREIGREEVPANDYFDGGTGILMQLNKE
jgi:RimJ/RimL family protein N-acetyltransferase